MPSYYFPSIQCSAIAKELLQILLVIIPGSQGQHVWVRYGLKDCESQLRNVVGFHARFHQQLKNVNSVSSQGIFPLYLKSKLNKAGLDHFLNCWMILSNKCSQRSVKDFVDLLQLQNLSSVVNPLTQGNSEQEVQKYHDKMQQCMTSQPRAGRNSQRHST